MLVRYMLQLDRNPDIGEIEDEVHQTCRARSNARDTKIESVMPVLAVTADGEYIPLAHHKRANILYYRDDTLQDRRLNHIDVYPQENRFKHMRMLAWFWTAGVLKLPGVNNRGNRFETISFNQAMIDLDEVAMQSHFRDTVLRTTKWGEYLDDAYLLGWHHVRLGLLMRALADDTCFSRFARIEHEYPAIDARNKIKGDTTAYAVVDVDQEELVRRDR